MENRKLRIGVFGCGKMGVRHVRAIQMENCAQVVGVADPFIDKNRLESIPLVNAGLFLNGEDLLEEVQPDVVHVCAPPHTHVDLATLAIKYGAHVYVEKPFSFEAKDAESVVSLANRMGVKVCAGHQILFERTARAAEEALTEIREIVYIESYFSFRQVRKSLTAVEQLIDVLPHPVYLLLHFLRKGQNSNGSGAIAMQSVEVRASGDVYGILRMGDARGVLIVTLRGRPIESYLRIVGTNGWVFADFVRGTITKVVGPGSSAISILLSPYSQAKQMILGTTKSMVGRILQPRKSYPGLCELIGAFYKSIIEDTPSPISENSIVETVRICEAIGRKLKQEENEAAFKARTKLECLEKVCAPPDPGKELVLVTGGTGFLGRAAIKELRSKTWPVRVVARRLPPYSGRIPGVAYVAGDLADSLPLDVLEGVKVIVHCAAETEGAKESHERNTIAATRNIINLAAAAGIKRLIHISSLAVLKPSREVKAPLDENSPVDYGNLARGTYVWAKAEAERLAAEMGKNMGLNVRIIRPGALVDFKNFQPPGRLGREAGPFFVAVGSRRSKIPLCDVQTAAEVIKAYAENFDSAPRILNLVEEHLPTRGELIARLQSARPDLKVLWIPEIGLKLLSPFLELVQRVVMPGKIPVNIAGAFASEKYKTALAETIIQKARESSASIGSPR